MATFTQSPAGQTSLAMPSNNIGITALLGGTTITGPDVIHDGSSSVVLSLTGEQAPPAGIYPIYRRKTRIISTAIES
jgi:hypothetical protein